MSEMRRRDFITLLGGAAAAWPLECDVICCGASIRVLVDTDVAMARKFTEHSEKPVPRTPSAVPARISAILPSV